MSTSTPHDQLATAPDSVRAPVPESPSRRQWLPGGLPTAVIVAALAGLAFWGHRTDWTMPKFSVLVGNDGARQDDWCKEHSVPESQCIECHPQLLPAGPDYGWCKVHGVAQCPLEHPDVAQTKSTPAITDAMLERASRALALKPRAENNSRCLLHQRRIQFASTQAVDKAGIDIAVVQERPVMETVAAHGEIIYDQGRMAHLASRVAGTVWRVEKQVGDRVAKGDVLALVDAADVGRAKSELMQAVANLRLRQANLKRLRPLAEKQIVEGGRFQEAEAAHEEATIRLRSAEQILVNLGLPLQSEDLVGKEPDVIARQLRFLGLPEAIVASLDARSTTSNLFPLRSPLEGVVLECTIVADETVDADTMLFSVADVSRLWLMLDVRQEDARYLSLGQSVLFRASDNPLEPEVGGSIKWISTSADDQTRTVKVRAELPNADGRLRAHTFGSGRIVLREEPAAIVVPSEAVHWDGACHIVFVRDKHYFEPDAPKFFYVRSVRVGVKDADTTEIIAGVLPGEVIASKNSVVLQAQLLRSNLGAGCCEVHSK